MPRRTPVKLAAPAVDGALQACRLPERHRTVAEAAGARWFFDRRRVRRGGGALRPPARAVPDKVAARLRQQAVRMDASATDLAASATAVDRAASNCGGSRRRAVVL